MTPTSTPLPAVSAETIPDSDLAAEAARHLPAPLLSRFAAAAAAVLQIVRDVHARDDIQQDALVKLFKFYSSELRAEWEGCPPDRLGGRMYEACRRALVFARGEYLRTRVAPAGGEALAATATDPRASAEEVATANEAVARVREAIDRLPQEQKAMIRLHYLAGQTVDQAAAALGISSRTGDRRIAVAVAALRTSLAALAGDDEGSRTDPASRQARAE